MMTEASLFGVQEIWLSNWLTPIWILGVGCLLGLVLAAVGWALTWALSLLPFIGRLAENARASNLVALVMTLLLAGLGAFRIWGAEGDWQQWLVLLGMTPLVWCFCLGLISLVSRRAVVETWVTIREGVLWPLLWITVIFASFSAFGWLVVRSPSDILASALRIPFTGEQTYEFRIPARADASDLTTVQETAVPVYFRKREIQEMLLKSDGLLEVNVEPNTELEAPFTDVDGNSTRVWNRREDQSIPFPDDETTALYVKNLSDTDVDLSITIRTQPIYKEALGIPLTALAVLGVFFLYAALSSRLPKISAIALATYKSEIVQPLFLILVAGGIALLFIFILIPYHTFGEDIKVLKDSGLTLLLVFCIIQAIWAASTSISDEIEGRTALTVLSKPLKRRDFIIGKYMGIMWTVVLMAVILGAMLLVCVAYKPIYDARESSNPDPTWQICYFEMATTIPGLVLVILEVSVLTSLSVAISTRLSMLPNFIICFVIYVLGHLTPLIVSGAELQFEIVYFFGQLIATIFPNLDSFNVQAAISTGTRVPLEYLGMTMLYSAIYSVIALLLALIMFEDRDLT